MRVFFEGLSLDEFEKVAVALNMVDEISYDEAHHDKIVEEICGWFKKTTYREHAELSQKHRELI